MSRFSFFYSATEAAAASGVFQLFPREPEGAPRFSSNDAEQLASLLDGTKVLPTRARNDVDQPLFRPRPPSQSVEQLFNAFSFSITHEIVYRDKPVLYNGTPEGLQGLMTRSRTPSSDEPSPRKSRMYSPNLNVRTEASSNSDGSEDGVAHKIDPARQRHLKSGATHLEYYAIYSQGVLQTMDTQFSKWSYSLNEGTTAIPFVMAQAPTETHERLTKIDRKLWTTGNEDTAGGGEESHTTAKALLERSQKGSKRLGSSKLPGAAKDCHSSKVGHPPKDQISSKRRALIARSKAAKDSSLVASISVGQRRSALHKNKNRRSIMPSPPPTARKLEAVREPEPQAGQSKSTILILNQEEDDQRYDVDSALHDRRIDFNNMQQMEALMEQLGKGKTRASKEHVIEEIEEMYLNDVEAEQTGRGKVKANRKAKSSRA